MVGLSLNQMIASSAYAYATGRTRMSILRLWARIQLNIYGCYRALQFPAFRTLMSSTSIPSPMQRNTKVGVAT